MYMVRLCGIVWQVVHHAHTTPHTPLTHTGWNGTHFASRRRPLIHNSLITSLLVLTMKGVIDRNDTN